MPATSDQIDALAKNKANEVLKLASDQMKAGTFQVDSFEDGVNKMIDSWKGEIDLILSNAVWGKDSCHPRHDGWHILAYSKYDSDISVVVVENKIVGFSPKCSRFSRVVTCMWGKVLLSDAIKVFVYNSATGAMEQRGYDNTPDYDPIDDTKIFDNTAETECPFGTCPEETNTTCPVSCCPTLTNSTRN